MKYIHIKTGKIYHVLSFDVTNATNAQDGQQMVHYYGEKKDGSGNSYFVREISEFELKFTKYHKL